MIYGITAHSILTYYDRSAVALLILNYFEQEVFFESVCVDFYVLLLSVDYYVCVKRNAALLYQPLIEISNSRLSQELVKSIAVSLGSLVHIDFYVDCANREFYRIGRDKHVVVRSRYSYVYSVLARFCDGQVGSKVFCASVYLKFHYDAVFQLVAVALQSIVIACRHYLNFAAVERLWNKLRSVIGDSSVGHVELTLFADNGIVIGNHAVFDLFYINVVFACRKIFKSFAQRIFADSIFKYTCHVVNKDLVSHDGI